MRILPNTRKALIALAIVVAVVAVVVPTCRMVGCSMSVGSTMPWGQQTTAGLFGDCGGTYVVNATPTAVVPAGADSLVVALVAAFLAAAALFSPRSVTRSALIVEPTPPPPPEDPRGMRLRL